MHCVGTEGIDMPRYIKCMAELAILKALLSMIMKEVIESYFLHTFLVSTSPPQITYCTDCAQATLHALAIVRRGIIQLCTHMLVG